MCPQILKKLLQKDKFYISFEKLPYDVLLALLKHDFTVILADDEKSYDELIKEFLKDES